VIYVDCQVLHADGALLDTLSVVALAALHNTRIPTVQVSTNEEDQVELEVSDDPGDFTRLDTSGVPLCVTLCKIGSHYVVDPGLEELACVTSRVAVGIDTKGDGICGLGQAGLGGLPHAALNEVQAAPREPPAGIRHKVEAYLAKEDPATALAVFTNKIGFFAK